MLAHGALSALWSDSDFQPDGAGCCHVCCAPCAALHYLDGEGVLDALLREWPDGMAGSGTTPDGRTVDRVWMYRQWSGSKAQEQCGHRLHERGCQMLTPPPPGFPFPSFSCNCNGVPVPTEEAA